jgi:hypothetical protein
MKPLNYLKKLYHNIWHSRYSETKIFKSEIIYQTDKINHYLLKEKDDCVYFNITPLILKPTKFKIIHKLLAPVNYYKDFTVYHYSGKYNTNFKLNFPEGLTEIGLQPVSDEVVIYFKSAPSNCVVLKKESELVNVVFEEDVQNEKISDNYKNILQELIIKISKENESK